MRALLIVYLCVYYLLIAVATVTIWRSGLIDHLPRGWTYAAIGGAMALGVGLWASRKPRPPEDHQASQ